MESLNLGATSLIKGSWVFFGSSLKPRVGFRYKRLRRVARIRLQKWRFRVQQMSGMEQMTKQELARSAKRSESLRQILKQYGISVESPEENNLNCKEKHDAAVPYVIDDSEMNTTEELPDLRWEEKYCETLSITEDVLGPHHHNCKEKHDAVLSSVIYDSKMTTEEFPVLGQQGKYCETVSTIGEVSGQNHHLKPGALFTSSLLHVLGFCILCTIGTLHAIISRKTLRGHHHDGSKRTRWRTALTERNEPVASDEHDTSPEYTVNSAYQDTDGVDEACGEVKLEYKRFLLECGLSEF